MESAWKHACLSTNDLLNFSSYFFSSYSYRRWFFFLFRAFEDLLQAAAEEFPRHSSSPSSFQFEFLPLSLQLFFFFLLSWKWYLVVLIQDSYFSVSRMVALYLCSLCSTLYIFYLPLCPRWINGQKYTWHFVFFYG